MQVFESYSRKTELILCWKNYSKIPKLKPRLLSSLDNFTTIVNETEMRNNKILNNTKAGVIEINDNK